jgi:uncharacterized membrane protein
MITIGLCLIYYGVALFGYQLYGWFSEGAWGSFSVLAAWISLFGRPDLSFPVIGPTVAWFMEWPLSLALITLGLSLLCSVTGFRQHTRWRLARLRAKWFAENASAAGYEPWTIKGAVREFRKDVLDREAKGRTGFN